MAEADENTAVESVTEVNIAVIEDPRVVEKIIHQVGVWHDPPACPRRGCQGTTPKNRVGRWTRCEVTKTC